MTFLLELNFIVLLVFFGAFLFGLYSMMHTNSNLVIFGPMVLIGLFYFGFEYFGAVEASDSLESFCLNTGFSDSRFINLHGSYCLDEENDYLIEQEAKIVNGRWLLIKSLNYQEVSK